MRFRPRSMQQLIILVAFAAGTLLISVWLSWPPARAMTPGAAPHITAGILKQRQQFLQAREALADNDMASYRQLHEQLTDYPLRPYLDYEALADRLDTLPFTDVDHFLDRYPDTWLAATLERLWVFELADQERWADVVRYYNPGNTTVILQCQALRARLETGDRSALDEVAPLWNVGRSQYNECDPVFEEWLTADRLTPELAWDRFGKTMQAGRIGMARYIAGLMPEEEQSLAELYLLIDSAPEQLATHSELEADHPKVQEIILHGIRKLSRIDAPRAMMLLHRHDDAHDFGEQTLVEQQRHIALQLLLQGFEKETASLLRNSPELATSTLVAWLLRDALQNQDWERIETWLDRLPEAEQQSEQWTYWRARMLEQKGSKEDLAEAERLYHNIARTRSFHGFLAADRLGQPYAMAERPVPFNGTHQQTLYAFPSIVRAHELYHLGDKANAREEWEHATQQMNREQRLVSGQLASRWGWHRNSIQAMIRTQHWDDLELRFPLAYDEHFRHAAEQQRIQPHLLYAVARQESAFMHDVRSPAGARGLMQLLPSTARQTANGNGEQVSAEDLYRPDVNIALGSQYLSEMLDEFDGNRALAAAAYNAGPNRVKQWLRRTSDNPLPLDQWIETIPFAETRGYVQNVLAYSVIYGERMGDPVDLLTPEEAASHH
ncbi:MAG: transglycosylase SLT domain-containing protein [Pseudohongiellaceae bacterium]